MVARHVSHYCRPQNEVRAMDARHVSHYCRPQNEVRAMDARHVTRLRLQSLDHE